MKTKSALPVFSIQYSVFSRATAHDGRKDRTEYCPLKTEYSASYSSRLLTLLSASLLLLVSLSSAKLPEPDTIYFGKVRHNTSTLFVPSNTGDFVIVAKLNGAQIAQTTLNVLSSDYKLNIPIDDGQEPRISGAARAGERIKVYIRNTLTSTDYEVISSVGLGIALPTGDRGIIQSQDMAVAVDLGGMGAGFASYGVWAAGYGLPSDSSDKDTDGDGKTNLSEFIAGTDPTSGSDGFSILEVRRLNGVTAIKYGPIHLSRVYSLWSSPQLSEGGWTKITDIHPTQEAEFQWYDHVVSGTTSLFYRLKVEVQ